MTEIYRVTLGVTKRRDLRDIGVGDSKDLMTHGGGWRGDWLEQKKMSVTLPSVFWVIKVNI